VTFAVVASRFIPDFLHEKNLSDLSHWNEPRMQMSEPEEPREVEKPREKESVMDAVSFQVFLAISPTFQTQPLNEEYLGLEIVWA